MATERVSPPVPWSGGHGRKWTNALVIGVVALGTVLVSAAPPTAGVGGPNMDRATPLGAAGGRSIWPLAPFVGTHAATRVTNPIWAGYVDAATGLYSSNPGGWNTSGNISEVTAEWEQPNVTCPAGSSAGYEQATWVGIDGFGNAGGSVEQAGVFALCTHQAGWKSPQLVLFTEFYPYQSLTLNGSGGPHAVSPGNLIQATISYNASACVNHRCGIYTLEVDDLSSGSKLKSVGNPTTCDHPFVGSNYTACETGPDGSAECISEGAGYTANYVNVSITNCDVTENGHLRGIGMFGPLFRLDQNLGSMGSGRTVQRTSRLTSGTLRRSNFQVTWLRYN